MERDEERGADGYRGIGGDGQVEGNEDGEKHRGGLSKDQQICLLLSAFS